jgi:hypothetical protein
MVAVAHTDKVPEPRDRLAAHCIHKIGTAIIKGVSAITKGIHIGFSVLLFAMLTSGLYCNLVFLFNRLDMTLMASMLFI